jgi:hypothetical protein
MRSPLQKVQSKFSSGKLVTHYDLAALRRQLARMPEDSPDRSAVAKMIVLVRPVAYTPAPWWYRFVLLLGFYIARMRFARG